MVHRCGLRRWRVSTHLPHTGQVAGKLQRLPVPRVRQRHGGTPEAISENLGPLNDLIVHAARDGSHLYFVHDARIFRLPVDAEAITRDLVASEVTLEAIQTIQGASHDVPLVAGRRTFVRAYARIGASSDGVSELPLYPGMVLHGERDGIALEGSPLRPLGPTVPLRPAAIDRTTQDNAWLFELPESWARDEVTLTAVVNHQRTISETDFANNQSSRTVTFFPVQGLCVDILPVLTHSGISVTDRDTLTSHFARARTLLPVDDFGWVFRGGTVKSKPWTGDPYNMWEDDDKNELMFHLTMEYMFSGDPPHCAGRRTIRAVAVDDSDDFGLSNGVAPFIYFLVDSGGRPENQPLGGVSGLAHEVGHQLGQRHIGCPMSGTNAPANLDGDYPHPPCQLDSSNDHIGLDPITRLPIVPLDASGAPMYSDFMSYQGPYWASDYVYKRHFDQLVLAGETAETFMAFTLPATSGEKLLVSGYLTSSGSSYLDHAYQITDPAMVAFMTDRLQEWTVPADELEVVASDAGGAVLQRQPLRLIADLEDEGMAGEDRARPFFALLEPSSDLASVDVVDATTGNVLLTQTAGPGSPTVTITQPAAGAQASGTLSIAWNGQDPDGDSLQYRVFFSPDDGASWVDLTTTTAERLTVDLASMPGGPVSLVKVLASDGLRSTEAIAGPFATALHAPEVQILSAGGEVLGADPRVRQSEVALLTAAARDAEDGELDANAFTWELEGPVVRSSAGASWRELDLLPGSYTLTVTAQDGDGQVGRASTALVVQPKQVSEGTAPHLDGRCDDAGYGIDTDPFLLRAVDGNTAEARWIRAGEVLYLCVSGLAAGGTDEFIELRIDGDRSGGDQITGDDRFFRVFRSGQVQLGTGDGAGGIAIAAPSPDVQGGASDSADGRFWSAELVIDRALVGSWDSLINATLAQSSPDADRPAAQWPAGATLDRPEAWGAVALGAASFPDDGPPEPEPAPAPGGCQGCSGSDGGSGGALFLLGLLACRRRRRSCAPSRPSVHGTWR